MTIFDIFDEVGIKSYSSIDVNEIPFDKSFRTLCEMNSCGKYNTSWSCPPACGDIESLIKTAKTYRTAYVFSYFDSIDDSYDIENMLRIGNEFAQIIDKIKALIKEKLHIDALYMGAGSCNRCKECSYLINQPCRYPDLLSYSLETYGIGVSQLALKCNMK